ncbi:hypothetical protein MAQ5080_00653 [Marinomonas aquimarina]|uniref:Uncharacterized protein n=1 Tax=Marinomonas aquimarina TaxID=295068 RepID=A0A1A8T4L0_9GAMM|nr:hypothetical protein [Marinomonas aquimarina]SBS26892.1 hypothetical protein MAQ5080_00653 [Marinomonas aquimarina]
MTGFLVTIIVGVTIACVVVVTLVALLRFQKERQERQRQELEQLSRRCYRIVDLLNCLTDRYLPLMAKQILVEYLISSVGLLGRYKLARDLEDMLPGYIRLLDELKNGQQASLNDKVQTHVQLSQVQQGLQSVPLLLRGLVSNGFVDKATAKDQVTLVRFSFSLAHHDLLVKEALASLELDKKASALEKLRHALAEMEKVASFNESEAVINKLNNTIQRVENELFGKSSRAG